ncbi:hypothetical protein B14911_13022 [Bacillus sp. NRRL B-14911]|uniref:Uncharacterized protein n=1 Tax=Bacillus infantis NRRL B-14911 TaxID=1367477 RepID=U5LH68_9BACI|nr:hypothetical protein N288_24705 [Bacillus infantis NRRL B-14911]EAR67687.1 hypothetical protein B14911_13022 [Bacillus sp. NRRL B-14911]
MNKFEKNTLKFLLVFGLISFINLMRKPPVKDWMLIFLFKGYFLPSSTSCLSEKVI